MPIDNIISVDTLNYFYSKHLQLITTSENSSKNYGAFFRLFPNSKSLFAVPEPLTSKLPSPPK